MNVGMYLPVFIILSSLALAFANVMTESLQKKYSRKMLYLVSIPIYIISLLGFVIYIDIYTNFGWIISGVACFILSAVLITFAETFFEKKMQE